MIEEGRKPILQPSHAVHDLVAKYCAKVKLLPPYCLLIIAPRLFVLLRNSHPKYTKPTHMSY